MKAPISWLRSLVELPHGVTTQQLADAFTRTGLQVEHIELMGNQVTGPVVVGRVVSFVEEPQKNGKTIRWCHVDCGEQFNITDENPDVTDGRGIICGADNFAQGDYVVVALPGAELPGGFKISSRRTYGHVSDGMICAADELGICLLYTSRILRRRRQPRKATSRPTSTRTMATIRASVVGLMAQDLHIDAAGPRPGSRYRRGPGTRQFGFDAVTS